MHRLPRDQQQADLPSVDIATRLPIKEGTFLHHHADFLIPFLQKYLGVEFDRKSSIGLQRLVAPHRYALLLIDNHLLRCAGFQPANGQALPRYDPVTVVAGKDVSSGLILKGDLTLLR